LNLKKLKINLYGESWTLKKFECSSTELSSCLDIAKQMKLNIEEALLSPFFYYNLRLTSIPSLEYLPGKNISGLLDTPSNQIEIWFDGIRISKLKISDFKHENLLFPLYNVEKIEVHERYEKGIYVEQKAYGLIGSYETLIDSFKFENLNFKLLDIDNKTLLQKLIYKNKEMKLKKKDTLIRYQNGFQIIL
jgi:hypothetical protein